MSEHIKLKKSTLGLVAIILVLVTYISSTESKHSDSSSFTSASFFSGKAIDNDGAPLKFAFYRLDSLEENLLLYKQIEAEIKTESDLLDSRLKKKQDQIKQWDEKWQKKGQLLSSEQKKYMEDAQMLEQEARLFEQTVQTKFLELQNELTRVFFKRVSNTVKELAEENGFDVVSAYQFGQTITYYHPDMDITAQLIEKMNAEFKNSNHSPEKN